MATYENQSANSLVSGSSGDDHIINNASAYFMPEFEGMMENYNPQNVTINADTGNDTIENSAAGVSINAGTGDDSVYNKIAKYGGMTDDEDAVFSNYIPTKVTIEGGAGADSITNEGSDVTIDGGAGEDFIYNKIGKVFAVGSYFDLVENDSSPNNVTLNGGADNDSIRNEGNNVTIDGGAGDDSIVNSGSNVTIDGGEGNDSITNSGDSVTIDGGAGADSIINSGNNVVFNYNAGDGDDTISGFNETSSLSFGASYKSAVLVGNNFVFTFENGDALTIADVNVGDSLNVVVNGSLSKVVAEDITLPAGLSYADNYTALIANAAFSGTAIDLSNFASSVVSVDATAILSNISIVGNDNDNYLVGGLGANYFNGKGGNDTILNIGDSAIIEGGAGADSIISVGLAVSINSGDDADNITNFGDNATINAGAGNDIVVNTGAENLGTGSNVLIMTGDDADYVVNGGSQVTIEAGAGADSIYNDSVTSNVTINGGAGDDVIENYGSAVSINGGDGADSISNSGNNVTISGGSYGDSIYNSGSNVTIDAGEGSNNYVSNEGANVSITGGAQVDNISNSGDNVIISTGGATDSINNSGANVTITGGAANDTIINSGANVVIEYNSGDGSDTIIGFNATSSLKFGAEYESAGLVGDNFVFNFGSGGSLTVKDINIGDQLIVNVNGTPTTITALPLGLSYDDDKTALIADSLFSGAINLGSFSSSVVSVNAAALTNGISITGNDKDNYLIGGSGADYISGGEGNDTLTGNGGADTFAYDGKGADVITDHASEDKISLGAAFTTAGLVGDNFVFNFGGGSSLTVDKINIDDELTVDINGNTTTITALPLGLSYDDNKTALTASSLFSGDAIDLNGGFSSSVVSVNAADLTNAVSITGNAKDNYLIGGSGADYLIGGEGNDSLTGNAGADTFVYDGKGADVITDYTAGEDKISLGAAFTSAGLVGDNFVFDFGGGSSLTVDKINIDDELTVNINGSATTITALPLGLSYDDNKTALIADSLFSGNEINLGSFSSSVVSVNAAALTNAVSITGNAKDNYLIGGSGADYISGGEGSDTLTGNGGADTFVYDGAGADVITDYASEDKISLGSDYVTAGLVGDNFVFNFGGGSSLTVNNINIDDELTVINANGGYSTIVALPLGLSYDDDAAKTALIADSLFSGEEINLGSFSSTVVTVDAAALSSAVNIVGNAKDNVLIGGDGSDSLTGGAGKDTFVFSAGNDVITDYKAGEDIISLGADYVTAGLVGDDFVFNFGGGSSLTLSNVKIDGELTVINASGSSVAITSLPLGLSYNDAGDALIADSLLAGNEINLGDYDKKIRSIDASALSAAVKLVGNDYANTLTGGAGSDSLTGGKGKDTFVYGAGNDVITDYENGDTISLGAAFTTAGLSDGKYIFNFSDGGSLTVNNVKLGDKLTVTDKDGKITTVTALPFGLALSDASNGLIVDTLFAGGEIDLTDYSKKVRSIDASALSSAINLVGNGYGNTLTGGKGSDSLTGGNGNDLFVYSAGADVVTDYKTGDRIDLGGASIVDVTVDGSDVSLDFGGGNSLALNGAAGKRIQFREGNKFTYNYFGNHAIIDGNNTNATLTATATGFSAANFSRLLKIDAAGVSTAISITGNSKSNRIYASDNGASINGGKGNDTLYGGSGVDLFIYENGGDNDVIYNYAAGEIISLTGGTASEASLNSKGDAVLKVGNGRISVKGAADKEITISENDADKFFADNVLYGAGKVSATLSANYSSTGAKTFDATVTTIDASDVRKRTNLTATATTGAMITGGKNRDSLTGGAGADSISGNNANDLINGGAGADNLSGDRGKDSLYGGAGSDSLYGGISYDLLYGEDDNDYLDGGRGRDTLYGGAGADSLYGSAGNDKLYGDAGNDTLTGGAGNDTLWGGDGADTFVYGAGDGKDIISGFSNEDTLTFDGLDLTSATVNTRKSEIYLQAGATKKAVTLKEYTAEEFNINGDTYTISGNTLAKK